MSGNIIMLHAERPLTPLALVKTAANGDGDTERGLLAMLADVPEERVPEEIAAVWRQMRALDAALSVMANEALKILEGLDPQVSPYID